MEGPIGGQQGHWRQPHRRAVAERIPDELGPGKAAGTTAVTSTIATLVTGPARATRLSADRARGGPDHVAQRPEADLFGFHRRQAASRWPSS